MTLKKIYQLIDFLVEGLGFKGYSPSRIESNFMIYSGIVAAFA
jgi:hypothetical protein